MAIYAVTDKTLLESHPPRLVKATSRAAAIKFVASKYKAEAVNTERLADLHKQGVAVEDATGTEL